MHSWRALQSSQNWGTDNIGVLMYCEPTVTGDFCARGTIEVVDFILGRALVVQPFQLFLSRIGKTEYIYIFLH